MDTQRFRLSMELPLRKKSDLPMAIAMVKRLGRVGISSFCIPNYYLSSLNIIAAARTTAKYTRNITYTQVCRGFKDLNSVQKQIGAVARIKSIRSILAVTSDRASSSDISIFDLIRSISKKRFKVAAAVVFTRNNEAWRMAKKAACGATAFSTQPVFPSNNHRLIKILKRFSPPPKMRCSINVGVLAPFQAAVCRKIAKEKPDFISDTRFITGLEAAEKKSPVAAYMSTVSVAKTNLKSALKVAAIVNNYKKSSCKVRGIHFYGLSDRVFGKGRSVIEVRAEQLLHDILHL